MHFVDCISFEAIAGHGGPGAVAYRREKYIPKGGPSGGNGGRGGDIVLVADANIGTLIDLRYRKIVKAEKGHFGMPKHMTGRDGEHVYIRVPVGTLVRDAHTTELITDLANNGDRIVIAKGGKGGFGNAHFKTSTNQTPSYAQDGIEGDIRMITLELKLLADIGIIGFPSVGKSTLISVISNAKPKIADYHFTTLVPNLGIVKWHEYQGFVVADIPGLIEGAHHGHGLGFQFLRHIERCRALLHVIEITPPFEGVDDGRDPIRDFDIITRELRLFASALADRPTIVALGKMDLPFVREQEPALRAHFEALGHTFISFSAATRDGLKEVIDAMGYLIEVTPIPDVSLFTAPDALPIPEPEVEPEEEEIDGAIVYSFEDDDEYDGDDDGDEHSDPEDDVGGDGSVSEDDDDDESADEPTA